MDCRTELPVVPTYLFKPLGHSSLFARQTYKFFKTIGSSSYVLELPLTFFAYVKEGLEHINNA